MKISLPLFVLTIVLMTACGQPSATEEVDKTSDEMVVLRDSVPFPAELVQFQSMSEGPVFGGTGKNTWDQKIRERGYILKEGTDFFMWYTGYRPESKFKSLGYATSPDGLSWTRYAGNPIYDKNWTEDMMVLKVDDTYHMFAEGESDVAHRLTSKDRIHWTDHGSLDIRYADGRPLSEGPYGTPTVWREDDIWYLFYERNDLGIWLATSKDLKIWTNMQDDPVIEMGPELYDQFGLAVNQIIKYEGWYYAYYHGTAFADWREWSTNVAASPDLIHWRKYSQNPIMGNNTSSGIVVPEVDGFRLYTMHDKVEVHLPKSPGKK
ncbi:MAG: glycosylase [Saprospiraceae bacterium]|nr:glycosylase [Saprospiraceae bacterium]